MAFVALRKQLMPSRMMMSTTASSKMGSTVNVRTSNEVCLCLQLCVGCLSERVKRCQEKRGC